MNRINNKYRQYELHNGLVVAMQKIPTQTTTAKLRVNYGCSHEEEGEEGMAHFLEHCLVTGGSLKYNPHQADEIRGSFGHFNAFTTIGRTLFFSQMLNEDIEIWLDYVSSHVFTPGFDEARVGGERERVLREISDAKSTPRYGGGLEFNKIFYRGHPKGIFKLGREEVVRNANLEKIINFYSRGYNPNNMDLILVGSLPKNIDKLIEKYFGPHSRGNDTRREFPQLAPLPKKTVLRRPAPERLNIENPKESSAQIFLSFTGPMEGHEDEYAVRMMTHLLGGDTNSLFFQNIGLKKGLAYAIEASFNGNYSVGELEITASVPARRINESVNSIFEEIERIKKNEIGEETIERIRRIIKYNIAKTNESNEGHVSAIEMKLDEGLVLADILEYQEKVTSERIKDVANKYLPDKKNGKYVLYIRDPLKK